MIQIFNRSHYEDILVPSVEGFIPEDVIAKRYNHINNFEQLLMDNNTHIVKGKENAMNRQKTQFRCKSRK